MEDPIENPALLELQLQRSEFEALTNLADAAIRLTPSDKNTNYTEEHPRRADYEERLKMFITAMKYNGRFATINEFGLYSASETTGDEVAKLAARGLRWPDRLSTEEIRKLAASALTQRPDKG